MMLNFISTKLKAAWRDQYPPRAQVEPRTFSLAPKQAKPIDSDIQVCKSLYDLPPKYVVISGTSKDAKIQLSSEQALCAVVILAESRATIYASTEIMATDASHRLFDFIRQKAARDYGCPPVIWAIPTLIAELNKLRSDHAAKIEGDEQADSRNTEHWRLFNHWIRYAILAGASDIHIEVDGDHARIRYRVNGLLVPMNNGADGVVMAQPVRDSIALAFNAISDEVSASGSNFNSKEFVEFTISTDIENKKIKMRCISIPMGDGFDLIARFAREAKTYTYQEIGYEEWHIKAIQRAIQKRRGMVVAAGIPLSAKTTAIGTILESIATDDTLKVATIDTPIEKKLRRVRQTALKVDESLTDKSADSYSKAIQYYARGNPDVLSLGEVRSKASGMALIKMTQLGCLTFATTHEASALGIFPKFFSLGVDPYALTAPGMMNLFIHQSLVQVLCDQCKIPVVEMSKEVQDEICAIGERFNISTKDMHYKGKDKHCPACHGTGTQRQTVVCEMIQHDAKLLNLILKRKFYKAEKYWRSKSDGRYDSLNFEGKSSFYHALILAQRGVISPETVKQFGQFDEYPPAQNGSTEGEAARISNIARMKAS